MEQKQFILAINQVCEEKGISKEAAIGIVEAALASAYKKEYGKKGQIIKVELDEISGDMKTYQIKIVAEETNDLDEEIEIDNNSADEDDQIKKKFNPDKNISIDDAKEYLKDPKIDDEIEIPLPSQSEFGRIAAQTAKQVMIQKIREAEKEAIFDEFKDKEGEVVNGIVQRIEGRNIFIDIGKAVGIMYPVEQITNERYQVGQRIKVYILKLDRETKEASLILSRTNPEIIKKLFELEVPEIFSKTVEIKAIAREAGSRTKVAVHSNEDGIDPVGSCVGQRGSRIQTIINELGGEKIDIIEWNEDSDKYIQHALSPAKTSHLDLDEKNRSVIAYVDEDQLSLAIGKQGENVRLAAKLTGWKIDITEEKSIKKAEAEDNDKNDVEKEEEKKDVEVKEKKETKKKAKEDKEKDDKKVKKAEKKDKPKKKKVTKKK
ncbi:MAG: transcription termination/antitermination protein NusA [Candidatus Pacebacteria bacterium]|nr:transcription termination/antitermination protein NusA [Candidatus Paceibacterota bacterium]